MSSFMDSMVDWLDLDTVLLPKNHQENNIKKYLTVQNNNT